MKKDVFLGFIMAALAITVVYLLFFQPEQPAPVEEPPTETSDEVEDNVLATRSINQLTTEDLETGVRCKVLAASSIGNGASSDSYTNLYGELVTHEDDIIGFQLREDFLEDFTFILDEENGMIQQDGPGDRPLEYSIVEGVSRGLFAVYEKEEGNKFMRHLSINKAEGDFRYTEMWFAEGNGISIVRGECFAE